MRIIIVGAGGHAQVIADAVLAARAAGAAIELAGFVDDDRALQGQLRLGAAVLGTVESLAQLPHDGIVVAIGANNVRAHVFEQLRACGETLVTVIHPSAVIASDVVIGPGAMICAGVIVNTGTRIGDNVILNTGSTIDHHNDIGAHVHIAPGVHLGGEVRIGTGAFLGIGSIVLPQKQVGAWTTIGGGGVVVHDLPDHVTAVGIPARAKSTAR